MGQRAGETAREFKAGRTPPSPIVDSGVDVVTRERHQYIADWKKLESGDK